jgi:tetratricopeptide (TPR) repeat protein
MEAERLYSRALEQPSAGEGIDRGAAYRGRGLMRYRIGRYHDALADFSCAREMAIHRGDVAAQAEILLDEATALDWMDDYKASEHCVEAARTLVAHASSPILDARLLLGLGRSAFRFSRNKDAALLLERAVGAADLLPDEGYETLVIALMLLGFLLPGLDRLDDAHRAVDRTIALCDAHGDRLQLGATLNVRGMLRANLGDKEGMTSDLERSLAVARELGQRSLELMGEFNLGEYLLLMDDPDAAEPHVRRAQVLDRKISGEPGRAVVALLEARLDLHRGDDAAARAIIERIRAREAEARARGETEAVLMPSDAVLSSMVDLATRDAEDAEWTELEARSERFSVGQERIEVVETRAVAAARHGGDARPILERAVALAARMPNAMAARLRRRLATLTHVD